MIHGGESLDKENEHTEVNYLTRRQIRQVHWSIDLTIHNSHLTALRAQASEPVSMTRTRKQDHVHFPLELQ